MEPLIICYYNPTTTTPLLSVSRPRSYKKPPYIIINRSYSYFNNKRRKSCFYISSSVSLINSPSSSSSSLWKKYLKSIVNSGGGTSLLSLTSSAAAKVPFVATLAANPTFVSGFFAWLLAQSFKVFLHFCFYKKFDLRIMCSSGGMPSSHSALCTALTTSVAISHGLADSLFPVSLGFSLIVMYDAIGVRRHAGMQAQVLNLIVEDLFQGHPISKRKLKELLGHTPSQVVAGAVLGILVACYCCQGCFGAT
uniref:uncharacterized membrane protein YuiD n=1 Tax=Erigeron canadensis TaxID=72917 RepID=UPI001CB98D11|nr:uncharacterized membrane protein YuiD [Erigeron canadensis]